MCDAVLHSVNLRDADLRGADLRGAGLCSAYLYGADLCNADLRDVSLYNINLHEANLCGARIAAAIGQFGRYQAIACGGYISIGCLKYEYQWWANNSEEIGRLYHCSETEITIYGA